MSEETNQAPAEQVDASQTAEAQEAPKTVEQTDAQAAPTQAPAAQKPDDERLYAALAYIPVVSVVTAPFALYKKPESEFCELHATQGLGLFGLWFISLFVTSFMPAIGSGIWLLLLVVSVYGGVSAWMSKEMKMPFVNQFGALLTSPVKSFISQTFSAKPAAPKAEATHALQVEQSAEPVAETSEAPVETSTEEPEMAAAAVQEEAQIEAEAVVEAAPQEETAPSEEAAPTQVETETAEEAVVNPEEKTAPTPTIEENKEEAGTPEVEQAEPSTETVEETKEAKNPSNPA